MSYTLTLHNGPVIRTSWWKDEDRKEPAGVWWLEGGGLSRPATDVEIEIFKKGQELNDLVKFQKETIYELGREAIKANAEMHALTSKYNNLRSRCKKIHPCGYQEGHEGSCNMTVGG